MQATTTSVAATLVLVTVNDASAPAATVCETVVMAPERAEQVTPVVIEVAWVTAVWSETTTAPSSTRR